MFRLENTQQPRSHSHARAARAGGRAPGKSSHPARRARVPQNRELDGHVLRPESKLLCRDRPLTFEPAESEPGVRTFNTREESARRASGNKLSHSPRVPGTCASRERARRKVVGVRSKHGHHCCAKARLSVPRIWRLRAGAGGVTGARHPVGRPHLHSQVAATVPNLRSHVRDAD